MLKIKNILKKAALILAGTLLIASCDMGGTAKETEKETAYLVVNGNVARTANPFFELDTFTDITLKGVCNYDSNLLLEEQNVVNLGEWQSDENGSAKAKFYAAYIAVPIEKLYESWTFFVKASKNDTVFEDSKTLTMSYGANSVNFNLKLTEYSTEGEGGIDIEFFVKEVPVQLEKYQVYDDEYGYYNIKYKLVSTFDYKASVDLIPYKEDAEYPEEDLRETITTALTPVPVIPTITEAELQNADYLGTVYDPINYKFTYKMSEIPSGIYTASFVLDKGSEYESLYKKTTLVTVTDGIVSKETNDFAVTVTTLENAIEATKYTITYNLNGGSWEEGYAAPEYYYSTYANPTALPTGSRISRTDCIFVGWKQVNGSDDFVTTVDYSLASDVVYSAIWKFDVDAVQIQAEANGMVLSWNEVPCATEYRIYLSNDETNYSYYVTTYTNSCHFPISNDDRYVKVLAYDSNFDISTNYSNAVKVEAFSLDAPEVYLDGDSVCWNSVSNANGYKVYCSTDGVNWNSEYVVSTSYAYVPLSSDDRSYKVTAYNTTFNAESDYSNVVTLDASFVLSGLTVSGTTLSWDYNSYVSYYNVYVSSDGENFSLVGTSYSNSYGISSSRLNKYYKVTGYSSSYGISSRATNVVMVEGDSLLPESVAWSVSSNDSYYFTEGSDNQWSSNNQNANDSTATTIWTITLPEDVSGYEIPWSVSSESSYDKITIILDTETKVNEVSGESIDILTVNLAAGTHTITAKYSKDSSQSRGSDTATITLNPITYN